MDRRIASDIPVHDLIARRWSPRAFADQPVDPAILRKLLEAARWAPSSYNEQPWAFIVATKEQPEEYQKLLSCLIEFNQSWAKSAPVLLLTVAHLKFARNGEPNRHALHDVGQAITFLTLQATEEGLYVHQMAGIDAAKAVQTFEIPSDWEPVGAVAVGYLGDPASLNESLRQRETAPSTRKPLQEQVFTGRWGQKSALV